MKRKRLFHRFTAWAAAIAVIGMVAPVALARTVRLEADLATPMLLAGSKQRAYVRVALTGIAGGDRAPLNVALVIDRSGSMQGQKLAEAKRSAIMALNWLDHNDIVSVVTYESTVRVLVPSTKLGDGAAVRRAIQGIETGGKTALFAGISKGAQEVRKFMDVNRVNLVLLLSDGLANVGPSSPGDLGDLGGSLAREGIVVTTIGLGLDYNEDLMARLAYKSDGNHFFVEKAEDLARAYSLEFGDLLAVVAQEVHINVTCRDGVRPVRVLGREADISGNTIHASMSQIYGDQTRYLVFEVELPPGRSGHTTKLADISVGYHDLRAGRQARQSTDLLASFTESTRIVELKTNPEVMASVVALIGADEAERAMALRDAGKIEEARDAYLQNSRFLAEQATKLDSDELSQKATSNVDASQNLAPEDWDRERKAQQESQFVDRMSRARGGFAPIKSKEQEEQKEPKEPN